MKKVIVFGLVGTNIGGIETFLLNMNEAMNSEYIFDYIIEETECIHEERISRKGGTVYRIPDRKHHPIKNAIEVFRILSKNKDKYESAYFNLSSLSWIVPEIVAMLLKYKTIIHSHNAELIDKNSSTLYRMMNRVNKTIINRCNIVRMACSEYAGRFMFGSNRCQIIRNGIFVEKFKYDEKLRTLWRKELGIESQYVIGFVGRLAYQKNPIFAIDVFNQVQQQMPNAVFLIIGDGNLRSEAEEHAKALGIEQKIIFLGNTSKVNQLYNVMDFFLFPSRHEGLGIVLIEAQTNGICGLTSLDVVPKETFITDLFEQESLEAEAATWAEHCLRIITDRKDVDRSSYLANTVAAGYEITKEAKKLQEIVFDCDV